LRRDEIGWRLTGANSDHLGAMQDFRKLRAWREALSLAINVRKATNRFPRRGYTDLKAQMIRAAESIVHTIVEGCGAASQREFARFLEMSIKSTTELEGQLLMARAYGILATTEFRSREAETIDVRRSVINLRKRVLASIDGSGANAEPSRRRPDPSRSTSTPTNSQPPHQPPTTR
jgi:four helix bundle protein